MSTKKYLVFDIGGSNGRCLLAQFDGIRLSIEVIHRFENGHVRLQNHLFWDILGLWNGVLQSLRKAAAEMGQDISSAGLDTWAVDFGLLDAQDNLIGNPFCYRDPQTIGMMEEVFQRVPKEELFQITGIQFMSLNTLYQLYAMVRAGSPAIGYAKTLLLIPDLLNFWLTGQKKCEYTNASTTQLLNATTRLWDRTIMERLGLPDHIFPEILESGQKVGVLKPWIAEETGLRKLSITAVGSHDTASAVAGVPGLSPSHAYISSGTWGLLGVELLKPRLDENVFRYNFGNEGGVFHTIRLLRNIVNLWLVQECRRIWAQEGRVYDWDTLASLAHSAPQFLASIDPDDPAFLVPEHMPGAVQKYCIATNQQVPKSDGEILRVCQESLAFKYRYTLEKLMDILGRRLDVVHIIGGGAKNQLLCQFTANALNRPVLAGPVEATALGNLIVQMVASGDVSSLEEGRQLIQKTFPPKVYHPENANLWEAQYCHYIEAVGLPSIQLVI